MINELFKSGQNSSSINDTSLSLIFSLRINDQFLLQNQTVDEQRYQDNHRSNSETLMHVEEILFREEHEQNLVKSTSPNSPFLSEILSNKIDNKEQSIESSISCLPSLSFSLTRKPYNTLHEIPHLLSNNKQSITTSTNERTTLDERISNLLDIPTSTILETSSVNQSIPTTKTTEISQNTPSLIPTILENDHISQWIASQTSEELSTGKLNHSLFKKNELFFHLLV